MSGSRCQEVNFRYWVLGVGVVWVMVSVLRSVSWEWVLGVITLDLFAMYRCTFIFAGATIQFLRWHSSQHMRMKTPDVEAPHRDEKGKLTKTASDLDTIPLVAASSQHTHTHTHMLNPSNGNTCTFWQP